MDIEKKKCVERERDKWERDQSEKKKYFQIRKTKDLRPYKMSPQQKLLKRDYILLERDLYKYQIV